jgi:hypothetical protein
MSEQLTKLATEITAHLDEAMRHQRLSLQAFRLAGDLLLQAQKELYALNGAKKGWGVWIEKNHTLPSQQQCQKYMTLANHWHLLPNDHLDLTLTAALDHIQRVKHPRSTQQDSAVKDEPGTTTDATDKPGREAPRQDSNEPKTKLNRTQPSDATDGQRNHHFAEKSQDDALPLFSYGERMTKRVQPPTDDLEGVLREFVGRLSGLDLETLEPAEPEELLRLAGEVRSLLDAIEEKASTEQCVLVG